METHVLFGVSPFNSKFNPEYINKMLDWGFKDFDCVDVIHPHEEAKYLLIRGGDSETKAKKKSRKEFVRISNVIDKLYMKTTITLKMGEL